jgi:hypothetical protein
VDDGVLTLRGEKKAEHQDKDRGWSERYGRFERSIVLPDGADEENCQGVLRDGVLTVRMPKSQRRRAVAASARRRRDAALIDTAHRRRRCAASKHTLPAPWWRTKRRNSHGSIPSAIQGHLGSMGFGAHVRWRNPWRRGRRDADEHRPG